MKTALVYHPTYLEHETGDHPERLERLVAIHEAIDKEPSLASLVRLPAEPISLEVLCQSHTLAHVERVRKMAEDGGGWLDADTMVSPGSYQAALHAAGGAVLGVKAVVRGEVDNAFALVRPPGHHALAGRAMGFCLFNNVAVAARCALTELNLNRVLIVDWDVHHGNGTQETFYDDERVLYFSAHQFPHYPGTGDCDEMGRGRGVGCTVNVPLPLGTGDDGYEVAFREILQPAAQRFRPELILVSAGYDAHWADPLASMQLSTSGFAALTRAVAELASDLCQGRLVCTLEGGYDLPALSSSVVASLAVMSGLTEVKDPLGPSLHGRYVPAIENTINRVRKIHNL